MITENDLMQWNAAWTRVKRIVGDSKLYVAKSKTQEVGNFWTAWSPGLHSLETDEAMDLAEHLTWFLEDALEAMPRLIADLRKARRLLAEKEMGLRR